MNIEGQSLTKVQMSKKAKILSHSWVRERQKKGRELSLPSPSIGSDLSGAAVERSWWCSQWQSAPSRQQLHTLVLSWSACIIPLMRTDRVCGSILHFSLFLCCFIQWYAKKKNAGGNSGHWLLLSSMLRLNKYHQIHKYFDSESVLVLH